jgi:hypothetical protein
MKRGLTLFISLLPNPLVERSSPVVEDLSVDILRAGFESTMEERRNRKETTSPQP